MIPLSRLAPVLHKLLRRATAPAMAAAITSVQGTVQAEEDEEKFDVFDAHGNPTGTTERRSVVHASGIWHQAVYVCVFNPQGQILMQRRAKGKKVYPDTWDLSVAEHLSAGETYKQAVVRGLGEEVGITLPDTTATPSHSGAAGSAHQGEGVRLSGPLAARHARKLDLPDIRVRDYEWVETWRVDGYTGPVAFNSNEVSEVEWVGLPELGARMAAQPDKFTPWLRDEAALMGWVKL